MRSGLVRWGIAGLALAALLAPSSVLAATAERSGGLLTIEGPATDLDFFQSGVIVRLIDRAGGTISPGAGCTGTSPDISCGPADSLTTVTATLSEGNDMLGGGFPGNRLILVQGLGGDDSFAIDNAAGATAYGQEGKDRIGGLSPGGNYDSGGPDSYYGGLGRDTLFGGSGDDLLDCGPGRDLLQHGVYPLVNPGPLRIDLAAGTSRGMGADQLVGCENVRTNVGDDTVLGDSGSNRLLGRGGRDRLDGRGGGDVVAGERGGDTLKGGPGNDTVDGGAGADLLLTRDGERDNVIGGPGRDRARVDRRDRVRGVETIIR